MRVIHISVKTDETQILRIKFVLYCPTCALNLKIKRANFCRKHYCQIFRCPFSGPHVCLLEAILASSTSKSGIRIPLTDDEDFKSSTESTISTSLIQCIASVRNHEQVHTSVLSLIFQQANVAGVEHLSRSRSEICSRCLSAPQFFEESPSLGMTEFSADSPGWHL